MKKSNLRLCDFGWQIPRRVDPYKKVTRVIVDDFAGVVITDEPFFVKLFVGNSEKPSVIKHLPRYVIALACEVAL